MEKARLSGTCCAYPEAGAGIPSCDANSWIGWIRCSVEQTASYPADADSFYWTCTREGNQLQK